LLRGKLYAKEVMVLKGGSSSFAVEAGVEQVMAQRKDGPD